MIDDTIDTIVALAVTSIMITGCKHTEQVRVTQQIDPAPPHQTIEQFFTPAPAEVTTSHPPPFWPPHEHIGPGVDQTDAPWVIKPATF